MDKRHQRMLEDVLKLPGNETCADCHSPSPRWASVNLGIFICVTCASVHRKLGTHYSRVKSVTLDTWTREQIVNMRSLGNTASNAIFNPDERQHPPPTAVGHDERDSELEKYIRRKYEYGAFKQGATDRQKSAVPSSLNRARERDGRAQPHLVQTGPTGGDGVVPGKVNTRNPELNDVVVRSQTTGQVTAKKERDLPALPVNTSFTTTAPPRARPMSRSPSASAGPSAVNGLGPGAGAGIGGQLVDVSEAHSSTRPLQMQAQAQALGGYQGGATPHGFTPGSWQAPTSFQPQLQPQFQQPYPQQQHSFLPPGQTAFGFQHNNPFASASPETYPQQNPFPAPTMQNGMSAYSTQPTLSMYQQAPQQHPASFSSQLYQSPTHAQMLGGSLQSPGYTGQVGWGGQPICPSPSMSPNGTQGVTGQQGYFGMPQQGQFGQGMGMGMAQAGYGYGQSR